MQIFMYRHEAFHIWVYAAVTYLLVNVLPRQSQHKVTIVFLLSYLSYQHISSMIRDYGGWSAEVTMYTMVLVAKLWGFSFAYKDGGMPVGELSEYQKNNRIEKMPSVLEFLAYVSFCNGAILGPWFEFKDFLDFMYLENHYAEMPRGLRNG